MSTYREQSLKAKAIRQGAVDEPRGVRQKSNKDKPFVLESRWVGRIAGLCGPDQKWTKHGEYRTREIAQKVIDDHKRKHNGGFYEFRFRGEVSE